MTRDSVTAPRTDSVGGAYKAVLDHAQGCVRCANEARGENVRCQTGGQLRLALRRARTGAHR